MSGEEPREDGSEDEAGEARFRGEAASAWARLSSPAGLCRTCRHAVLLATARSAFLRCGLADSDPRFPRYPPLPVASCSGFAPQA